MSVIVFGKRNELNNLITDCNNCVSKRSNGGSHDVETMFFFFFFHRTRFGNRNGNSFDALSNVCCACSSIRSSQAVNK